MEQFEIAYLAGFIDGEGCIGTVPRRGYGTRTHNTTPRREIRLSATNENRYPLDLLQRRFGGTITPHHKPMPKRKNVWRWTLASRKAADAITVLLPYLRVKQEQARLIVELQATYTESSLLRSRKRHANGKILFSKIAVLPEIEAHRSMIYSRLLELNRRA